jgi:hypothetical protein
MAFFKEVGDFCEENRNNEELALFTKGLKKGLNDLQSSTMWLMQNAMAKPDNAGAASTDYMHLFGLVALGYMWALMAKAAVEKRASGADGKEEFLASKLRRRQVLHGTDHAETSAAQGPHRNRRGHHDGTGRGRFLSTAHRPV